MDYNIENIGPTKKKLTFEVPLEQVQDEMGRAVDEFRKNLRIKGFRPGKAPKEMIRRRFAQQLEQEVTQQLMKQTMSEAMQDFSDTLVSEPILEDSDFSDAKPFRFAVSFEVKPAFEIEGYKGLALAREKVSVTDEMVDNRLEEVRKAYATTRGVETDRPVADKDLAVIDYKAFVDGQPLEGGANPNYQIEVGSGRFHQEFEAGLLGLTKGVEKEIDVTFADDHYNPKLAGKAVKFQVKLIDIKEKVLPELDDEFAKDLGSDEIQTAAQLREKVREDLEAAEKKRAADLVREQAKDKLRALVEMELPENLVGQETEAMVSNTKMNLQRSGLSLEAMGLSEAKLRDDYRPEAERRIKTALILEKIAGKESIAAAEDDVADQVMEIARRAGQTPEVVREIYSKNNMMEPLKEGIVAEKTLNFVIDNATIEDVEPIKASPAEAGEGSI